MSQNTYHYIMQKVSEAIGVEFMCHGIQYTVTPQNGRVSLCNCATGETEVFADLDAFAACEQMADVRKKYVWADRIDHRYYAKKEEFIENAALGLEIEFICCGLGYFLSSKYVEGKRVFYVYCPHTQITQDFAGTEELLKVSLNGVPLDKCWGKIQIMCY